MTDTTQQSPDSSSEPKRKKFKPGGIAAERKAIRLVKEENDRLKAIIAEMDGREGDQTPHIPASTASVPIDPRIDPKEHFDERNDPIRWITEDTEMVYLLSSDSAVLRCPSGENAKLGKTGRNAWTKDYLVAQSLRDWHNMPTVLLPAAGPSDDERVANRHANLQWHYYEIVPEDGLRAFPEGHPVRDHMKAIIDPASFGGLTTRGSRRGREVKSSGLKFREFVRLLLQFGCATTYFNTLRNDYKAEPLINIEMPNPYASTASATTHLSGVSHALGGVR